MVKCYVQKILCLINIFFLSNYPEALHYQIISIRLNVKKHCGRIKAMKNMAKKGIARVC